MYNHIYNTNVNWFNPKTENQAMEDAGNITTGKDYQRML